MRQIYVVSDSTGETAERVVRATLLQFPEHKARIRVFTRVRNKDMVSDVIRRAHDNGAMIVFTLVDSDLRQFCYAFAQEQGVEVVDVIGAIISKVSAFLDAAPLNRPSADQPLSEEYFRRVAARVAAVAVGHFPSDVVARLLHAVVAAAA